ncbi:MAG: methyltransferase domain-containing protein, partial [Sciscionella sp.]
MRTLPFADAVFAEVTHLWCVYHVPDPLQAITEAARVLRPGGRYLACTAARNNDPEIKPEEYPCSPFDAEEAGEIIGTVTLQRWDQTFFPLRTREEVRASDLAGYVTGADLAVHGGGDVPARALADHRNVEDRGAALV